MTPRRRIDEPTGELPDSVALADFLDSAEPLEEEARYELVEQALLLLEGAYVHLRLKRAMHAVDPVQRLRLLARRMDALSDLQFHSERLSLPHREVRSRRFVLEPLLELEPELSLPDGRPLAPWLDAVSDQPVRRAGAL